jgi:hypothetical protein
VASIITAKDKEEKKEKKEKTAAPAPTAVQAAAAAASTPSTPTTAASVVISAPASAADKAPPAAAAVTTLINFEKYSLVAAKVTELLVCQSSPYCFEEVEFIQRWLGKVLADALDEETITATAKTLNDKVAPPSSLSHPVPKCTHSCAYDPRRTRGHRPSNEACPRRSPR